MKIEHIAFQCARPPEVAAWYCRHLGFTIKRAQTQPPFGHFLADASGAVMIEIYHNPAAATPDYRAMSPFLLHLAFQVDDVAAQRQRLLAAGATAEGEVIVTPEGDRVATLRDPWGFSVQLVKRAKAMV